MAGPATAQIFVPTHLSTALSQPAVKVGDELELVVNARIDDKWHLYASDFSDEVGPVVFTLAFKPSPAYALVGKLQSVKSHHEQDEVFKGEVAFWEKTGQLRQRIKVLQPGALTITATADYQSCTTVDGRCVPGSEPLTFGPLTVTGAAAAPATPAQGATGAAAPATATAKPAVAAATPATAVPADTSQQAGAAQVASVSAPDTVAPQPAAASAAAAASTPGAVANAALPAAPSSGGGAEFVAVPAAGFWGRLAGRYHALRVPHAPHDGIVLHEHGRHAAA